MFQKRDGVDDQAERCELVFLAFTVGLADLAASSVADLPGEPVPGLLHGELLVELPVVGVVDRVEDIEQMQGLAPRSN